MFIIEERSKDEVIKMIEYEALMTELKKEKINTFLVNKHGKNSEYNTLNSIGIL